MIDSSTFPAPLKLAHIASVSKKVSKLCKDNYRPVSVSPNIQKIYDRYMYKQMSVYLGTFFFKF